jgi:hypothetical protein
MWLVVLRIHGTSPIKQAAKSPTLSKGRAALSTQDKEEQTSNEEQTNQTGTGSKPSCMVITTFTGSPSGSKRTLERV